MRNLSRTLIAVLLLAPTTGYGLKRTAVGEPLKDFVLPTATGQRLQLSEVLGRKATLVVFWATWSPRSAEAFADYQVLYDAHGPEDLQVLAVNVEHQERGPEDAGDLAAFVLEHPVTFPMVLDQDLAVFDAYGVIAVPSTLLIDAQGQIVETLESYSYMTRFDFRERILQVLGELPREVEEPESEVRYQPKGKAARYYQMGVLLARKKMGRQAVQAFQNALAQDPNYAEAHFRLAELYQAQGLTDEAAAARDEAVSLAQNDPDPVHGAAAGSASGDAGAGRQRAAASRYVRMGRLLLTSQKAAAAVEVFQRAIDKDPTYLEAYLGLAEALEIEGRATEAAKIRARAASVGMPATVPPGVVDDDGNRSSDKASGGAGEPVPNGPRNPLENSSGPEPLDATGTGEPPRNTHPPLP